MNEAFRPKPGDASPRPPENAASTAPRELAGEALLQEYQFVASLIPLYRQFEMQAVGFAVAIYSAALGLIVASLQAANPERFTQAIRVMAALLPYPALLLVIGFSVMEVRIIRASRYIDDLLAPMLDRLIEGSGVELPRPLLRWESGPSSRLTDFEKALASSSVFVAIIAAPAGAGAAAFLLMDGWPIGSLSILSLTGLVALGLAFRAATGLSLKHEMRGRDLFKRYSGRAMRQPPPAPDLRSPERP